VRLGRGLLLAAAAAGAAWAAVRLPNTVDWRSASPYLDSARDLVNYREGSGRGRLTQWTNSARLLAARPLLGVGPGNWSVA
jgi:O-antigen ligase